MKGFTVDSKRSGWAQGYFDASVKMVDSAAVLDKSDIHIISVAAKHFQKYVASLSKGETFRANRTYYYGYVNGLYDSNRGLRELIVKVFNTNASDERKFLIAAKLFKADIVKADYLMFQAEGEKACLVK